MKCAMKDNGRKPIARQQFQAHCNNGEAVNLLLE